jgi:acyl-CoA thioesterase
MNTFNAHANLAQIHAAAKPDALIDLDSSWRGFGGIHGGLALSLLTAAMTDKAEGRTLQQVSGRFRHALREPFSLDVAAPTAGRSVSWLDANACEGGRVALSASAVFAAPGQGSQTVIAPPMPAAAAPLEYPVFAIPPAFVPFSSHSEIRPVNSARPFSGSPDAQLIAWVRLVDDDLPPDAARLVVLLDALAPSYSALLRTPQAIPTLTFTVTPGAGLAQATSPWVLLRAHTTVCQPSGWLLERIDAWTPEGRHLGSAEQLRVVIGKP